MDVLYVTSLVEFGRGGRLHDLLRLCVASCLRFYADVTRTYQDLHENSAMIEND